MKRIFFLDKGLCVCVCLVRLRLIREPTKGMLSVLESGNKVIKIVSTYRPLSALEHR